MATNTYVALDIKTVTSAVSSVTFTSISQAYTDLVLVARATGQIGMTLNYNGDTTSGLYSDTGVWGNGTTAGSSRDSNGNKIYIDYSGSATSGNTITNIVSIMNYSNTTTNKTCLARNNNAEREVSAIAGLWRNTNAISSITVSADGTNNFAIGSTFTLYGIAAWTSDSSTKASGGYVTSDSTYWYHTFKHSGTFIANDSITADILLIAGGGSGNGASGGGGGAGGLSYLSGKSITAGSYSCTIGAGGAGGSFSNGSNSTFVGITSNGGGYGNNSAQAAGSGGSGGGGGEGAAGGSATQGNTGGATGYGNAGGGGISYGTYNHGGGGGAGAAGQPSSTQSAGGAGGAGLNTWSSWATATNTGSNGYYAGGGGGGTYAGTGGTGGAGGGANGAGATVSATAAVPYTGGGGGGGGSTGVSSSGASGILIIRYPK
jgi:hypothetical protein